MVGPWHGVTHVMWTNWCCMRCARLQQVCYTVVGAGCAPLGQQALHGAPEAQAGRAGHDRIVQALVAGVLQLQHQVEAVDHGRRVAEALHVDVHVQAAVRVQDEGADRVA